MNHSFFLFRFFPMLRPDRRTPQLGVAIVLISTILFGLGSPAARATYAEGANFVLVALFTMFCRALFLVGYCAFRRRRIFDSRKTLPMTTLGAFFHASAMAAIHLALVTLQAPLALMILYLFPLGLLIYLAIRGEMPVTPKLVGMVLMALFGLCLVLKVFEVQGDIAWTGVFWAFVSAFFVGARMYVHGKLTQKRSPAVVGAENFILATGFTLLLVFWKLPVLPLTREGYGWLLLDGMANGFGSLLSFYALSMIGAFSLGLFGKLEPIWAALFSALLLQEYLGFNQYIGMAIVLGALVLYQLDTRPKRGLDPLAQE
ncbi:MAG: DMT family transporter, partial [Bdellovibrionales bacterium]